MTDYRELVKALRIHTSADIECDECAYYDDCYIHGPGEKMIADAAAAIEALQAQLPKRGEWVEENRRPRSSQFVCSECHRTAYDQQPTRDKAWRKRCRYAYCPNCGAKMNDSNASNALNALDNAQDGPIITPCRGCSDYDGYGGCKSKGGCARAKGRCRNERTETVSVLRFNKC